MRGRRRTARGYRAWRLVAAVALAALVGAVAGEPAGAATLKGLRGGGFLGVPSGDSGPAGEFTVGLHATLADGATYTYVRYQVSDRVEVGLTSTNFGAGGFGVLAAFRVIDEGVRLPAVVLGIEERDVYAVAARAMGSPFTRLHVGVRAPLAGTGYGPPLVFFGINRVLNPVTVRQPGSPGLPITTGALEFDGRYLNGGLTFQLGPSVQLDLAVQDRGWLAVAAGINISTEF